jgi:GntP family gluconate:H+ symporter
MELTIFIFTLLLLILSIARFKVSPFLALLLFGLIYGISSGIGFSESLNLLLEGFAKTLRWIALIMIFGTIIGEILNETGGSELIAHSTLNTLGKKRLPATMGLTGYIISIPVFVDVAYIMMQSVTEALTARSNRNILGVGLSLVAGLTATHALLPPTPGPLAVAGILEADLGKIILINFIVALSAMTAGLLWATYYCSKIRLAYDDKIQKEHKGKEEIINKNKFHKKLFSFLPILIPLLLIAVSSFLDTENGRNFNKVFIFLGRPVIALAIGIFIALFNYGRDFNMKKLTRTTEKSIEKSALVIMITGAGGAFGNIIQSSGIVDIISEFSALAGNFGFLFPFLLAALFTTTTGSLTVSMITSASIVMPLLPSLGMSPQLAAALIGSGSFCVFHVNSSFFWLLNKLHNIPVNILLRTFTLQSLFMGFGGLLCIVALKFLGIV